MTPAAVAAVAFVVIGLTTATALAVQRASDQIRKIGEDFDGRAKWTAKDTAAFQQYRREQ